jgi:Protein of unknown function (DUF992)
MRWPTIILTVCLGAEAALGVAPPVEIGVLTCTLGRIVDTAASSQTTVPSEAREMVCSFKPAAGPEETYAGLVKAAIGGINTLPANGSLLWSVRAPLGTVLTPGLLQQTYAVDTATPAGQVPPLLGERNTHISLYTLADKQEGSASKEKQTPPPFVVAEVELVLKASAG